MSTWSALLIHLVSDELVARMTGKLGVDGVEAFGDAVKQGEKNAGKAERRRVTPRGRCK